MSAFLCGDRHLDAILTYAVNERDCYVGSVKISSANVTNFGIVLRKENIRSLVTRYPQDEAEYATSDYTYKFNLVPVPSHVQVIKACNCYGYQACENDDYASTEAYNIIACIRERAISNLPGYEAAQWEISK